MAARPSVSRSILITTLTDAPISSEWLLDMGRRLALARVAHLICELAARSNAAGPAIGKSYELPLTQEQMGDILGLTAAHVNRMTKQLDENRARRSKRPAYPTARPSETGEGRRLRRRLSRYEACMARSATLIFPGR
ncbi:helix-turn-helix domain-containing protein [Sphingomonas sp. CFBP 8760]|uniref:helix-turn-helix domain-containing protein n=1 Tax=Sphingomonas sp. CFBP 8760 TaxID=2775282 RepID=UPI00406C70AB